MYLPRHFAETDLDALHQLMRAAPLATVVIQTPEGLEANPIPLLLNTETPPFGSLQGHIARANPLAQPGLAPIDALVIFSGAEAYISPSWYATKRETGKVVPTWNYTAVHAYGTLRVIDDASWVRQQVECLTAEHEQAFPNPWELNDAPLDYIDNMLRAIVGIEISITRLVGKKKASQNQPACNREGIVQGLRDIGTSNAVAMAAMIEAIKP